MPYPALPGAARSLWLADPATAAGLGAPSLTASLEVDACVIGGGIAGVTTALELARGGRSVALLERDRVAAGVTGHSTAKLSALQGSTYSELERKHGRSGAQAYAALNEGAIGYVVDRVGVLGIDCDLRRRPHALFAWDAQQRRELEDEAAAAQRAGLDAALVEDLDLLPFPTTGALVLEQEAELQIATYVLALAAELRELGGQVFEHTVATHVGEGSRPTVRTEAGPEVRARDVVIATHYPILDRGLYFPRLTPKRSYCIAVRVPQPPPEMMAISIGAPTRSLRAAPDPERPGEELLVVGGEGHPAGEQGDRTPERYRALWDFAQQRFGATEATHRWSAHDMTSADGMPYAGRLTALSRHVWVATGFRKWGLTNGTAAAQILAARILGGEHPHQGAFDTTRITPLRSAGGVVHEGLKTTRHLVGDRLRSPEGETTDILERGGLGRLLKLDGDLVAASRDADGTLRVVSPVCTHLGCRVAWNRAERSWDCPCHGSRFAPDGAVLQGPAVRPLERRDPGGAAGSQAPGADGAARFAGPGEPGTAGPWPVTTPASGASRDRSSPRPAGRRPTIRPTSPRARGATCSSAPSRSSSATT
ncbi:FAD-dependent oxidoreductase [Conexibacter woesei]|uniref:FAD-dependent oxidoreductase n=1 Tax=Conexibacter woesei TaxID=191495 RepID=UPI0018CA90AF|nr:FAD-dependent oxidoreductase [Conexibacter woesei]